jgi:glycosyltransferase involved in cell wall biosynthesis
VASGLQILVIDQWVPREEWFGLLAASRLALLLPYSVEGFYLPALEAMKYCDLVIVPDCIGNRGFCRDNQNCLIPEYDVNSILVCVERSLQLLKNEQVLTVFKHEMVQTLSAHTLANERKAFLRIMDEVQNLWAKGSV